MKLGHEVHIMTSNQLPLIRSKRSLTRSEVTNRIDGAVLHELPFFKIFPHPNAVSEIRSILRRCDILYVKNEIFELCLLKILKTGMNMPIICGIHTAVFYPYNPSLRSKLHNILYMSKIYGYLLSQCSAIHVLNIFDQDLMRLRFKVKEHKIFLIPLTVDTQLFCPKDNVKVNPEDKEFKILFLGKLDEQKGLDIFLDTIAILSNNKEFDQMIFSIVGSGELEEYAHSFAQTYPNVRYLGFVAQEKIVDLYNTHDVVVVPSRWETLSYVCLEAQSCGVPVIATNIPGPNGIIENGKTGLLIPPEDCRSLGDAILSMYRIKRNAICTFKKMKAFSRENILKRLSSKAMMCKMELLFRHVIRLH